MNDVVLSVENISKTFGGVHALDKVNIEIRKGEIHCLAGENGSGKSTLIKVISGYHKPEEGKIIIDGKEYSSMTPFDAIKHGIQVIYQDFSIFPNLTVMENLALNSEIAKGTKIVNYKRMKETAIKAMKYINLDLDLKTRVADLPVADKQMIAIARALVNDARIIILDEATASLTRKEVNALFEVINKLKREGVAIVFVSHKLDEVFEISDSITIFRNGKNVISCNASEMDEKKFSYYMTGRELGAGEDRIPIGDRSATVLRTENLSVEGCFSDVNIELHKGEILGVVGQLGSGRTELAMTLFGLAKKVDGKVFLNGKEVHLNSVSQAKKLRFGYVPEDRLTEGLFLSQSIENNIVVTELDSISGIMGIINRRKSLEEAETWIERLSIATDSPHKAAQKLSGGNQQKIVLSKWLTCSPEVLILNGPTVGVDIGAKEDIYGLLREYADNGMSIIIASDDIREVTKLCNRVYVMRGGSVVKLLEEREITEESLTEAAL